jgi:alpha-mannosidase
MRRLIVAIEPMFLSRLELPVSGRLIVLFLCLAPAWLSAAEPAPVDLSRDRVLYEVGYSHLDTQWRWTFPQVIREFIPSTVRDNASLFKRYPEYRFNWSGARRYEMMQEYHPDLFEHVRKWVAQGRWFPCGNSWDESDVIVPSAESMIRQILYGRGYFKREFGTESVEFMLPDCFGFPASMPSVLAHCGIRGFSTQKLTWGSAVGIPFNIGRWEGLDGQSVIAALNAGDYNGSVQENLSQSEYWRDRLETNGRRSGLFADYQYYGVGDRGGAPREESVQLVQESVRSTGAVRVVSARADQMFQDITEVQRLRLPVHRGDLLLTEHSAGSITSQGYMKRWNRMNELLADAAERASVAAHLVGAAPYPREKLSRAWQLILGAQMHDILPGTSLPKAYEYSWNDEIIALNAFAEVLRTAVGGVARAMDTRVDGVPLVVYNPLSIEREDVVEAEIEFDSVPGGVQVINARGREVATQLISTNGRKARFLFLASAPSVGFAVYGAKPVAAAPGRSELAVSGRSLENRNYRVTLNDQGDVSSIHDRRMGKELLAAPARLVFTREAPREWPAWNMDWRDRTNPPIGAVDGPAEIRIVERGPVRIALEVKRRSRGSEFVQTVRLASGGGGERIEWANQIDWQSAACALRAEFPLAISNSLATYNWEVGKIQRGNNNPKKYEVPSRQWFDLTDASGKYGVSILTGAKYGSDKPSDNLMRLTLLFTPGVTGDDYREQATQDWGRHEILYGWSSHRGGWREGRPDWHAARMEQPLRAFRVPRHPGKLGSRFSLLEFNSDQVAVRALKLAEDDGGVVVRLQELGGSSRKVQLTSVARVGGIMEINGVEKPLRRVPHRGSGGTVDFAPYQLRGLKLSLQPFNRVKAPVSAPATLPFNADVFSSNVDRRDGRCDDEGRSLPAELMGDRVISEGLSFAMGSRADGASNAVRCEGQRIRLPPGEFNRLYLLAFAVHGDATGDFGVDGSALPLVIQDWSGMIGQWDNRRFAGWVPELTYSITNELLGLKPGFIKRAPIAWYSSHRHHPSRDEEYVYGYVFKHVIRLPAGAKELTLPQNPQIYVLAVTMASNDNDAAIPTAPLYDDFTGRTIVPLRGGAE